MRKLLQKLLLLIVPIILISPGLDRLMSEVLKRSNSYADGEYPVWNDLYNGKINSRIVIYGTSRAFRHIDPTMIGDTLHTTAYNLGVNGHSFKTEYFRHFLLLKHNRKPDIILQTLDFTSFEKESDLYNQDQFLPYMFNNEEMRLSVSNGFSSIDYKIPMIRYYGKKEALVKIKKRFANFKNLIKVIEKYEKKAGDDT